jgi:hypothetical protein
MLVAIEVTTILASLLMTATLCLRPEEGRKILFQRRR